MTSSADPRSGEGEGFLGLLLRLRAHGITDKPLLDALEASPHGEFLPVAFSIGAWRDETFPLPCGQIIHSVDVMARMIAALEVEDIHTVLEIGTGSGFMTSVLARRSRKVRSIDRYRSLLSDAQNRLDRLGISNVVLEQADGLMLESGQGLYDRIIVDSAYPALPRELLNLMVSGGKVVTAIGEPGEEQIVVRLTKVGSRFEREDLFAVRFSSLQPGLAAAL